MAASSKMTERIKIKFGDTLKRMKRPFYRMVELRKKIPDLFNFPADADFMLTYVDEDGDVVTIFDDEDLSDALTQGMKVVKINVQLSNNKGGSISTQRLTSLQTPKHPYPKIFITDDVVAKVSKSVIQLLREVLVLHEALSKISEDLISEAVLSDPVLLVDLKLKIAQTYLILDSQTQSGTDSTTQNVDHDEEED